MKVGCGEVVEVDVVDVGGEVCRVGVVDDGEFGVEFGGEFFFVLWVGE